MRAFVDMEKVRLDFLLNTAKLADKFEIPLPDVPVTEARPAFHSAMNSLGLPTVENLEQAREELVSGDRYRIKPAEYPLNK